MARQKATRESTQTTRDMAGNSGSMAHSVQAMLRSNRRVGGDGRRIPMTAPKMPTLLESCHEYGVQTWLRPTRKPLP
ncbi:MAG: hypothetical protein OXU25_00500 [Thaumarchaeota archaeon]|nr:hypothetical protein [Nitrososphaerota archaeon]